MHDERNRNLSINILASKVGCTPQNLKQKVFEQFDSMNASTEEIESLITKHNLTKYEHAERYHIYYDDTPAAVMVEMLEEYAISMQTKKKSDDHIFKEMAALDPKILAKLLAALYSGNMNQFNELIAQNPEFLDTFIEKLAENEESDE